MRLAVLVVCAVCVFLACSSCVEDTSGVSALVCNRSVEDIRVDVVGGSVTPVSPTTIVLRAPLMPDELVTQRFDFAAGASGTVQLRVTGLSTGRVGFETIAVTPAAAEGIVVWGQPTAPDFFIAIVVDFQPSVQLPLLQAK